MQRIPAAAAVAVPVPPGLTAVTPVPASAATLTRVAATAVTAADIVPPEAVPGRHRRRRVRGVIRCLALPPERGVPGRVRFRPAGPLCP